MKLKLNELNANPFKKEINKGKLNEKIISKIRSNLKELGLMGALPIFKKDNKYYLVAGHHRVEALKRTFGKNYEIEVTLHNYSNENVLRGMIVENLTQRSDELTEVTDNLAVIRKYLKNLIRSDTERIKIRSGQGHQIEEGSIREIHDWLNKNGEVMSIGKISEFLRVYDNLDESLLKNTVRSDGGSIKEEKLSIEDAKFLARLDKKDQKVIKGLLDKTDLAAKGKGKLISEFKKAPEEVKEKVKSGEIDITKLGETNIEYQINESNKGKPTTEFIPNFKSRVNDFSYNVTRLEQQVALFRKVFYSKGFTKRFNTLGKKEKQFLGGTVQDIHKRIKKCYNEIESFMSQLEKAKKESNLLEVKK